MFDEHDNMQADAAYRNTPRDGQGAYSYGQSTQTGQGTSYTQSTYSQSGQYTGNTQYGQNTSYGSSGYGSNVNYGYGSSASQTSGTKKSEKKKGGAGKFFAVLLSGILFGICAGFTIVAVLRLFPATETDKDYLGHKPPVEIEKARPLMPEDDTEQAEKEEEALSEDAEDESPAVDAKSAPADDTTAGGSDAKGGTVVTDVTRVVDSVMPSVVSIFGTYEVTENYWGFEMQRREDGSGSGIIVGENDEELLVVTNNHVVADSTALSVQFIDSETCSAQVKGTDADSDLAVIAVRMTEIKDSTRSQIRIATLGDSDRLKVGEPAIAIGNALGYGQSVTTGVISALNRTYSQDEKGNSTELIQTDAAINPGNSGGALLNIYGEVIGINSSKLGGMVIEGMGYAIPISTAKPILEELMNKKTRTPVDEGQKGYLGISGINVTEDVKNTYGLPIGVYIAQVFDGTPAQRVGLKKGDIITSFDGEQIETMEELSKLLDMTAAGTEVELVVMVSHNGEYREETVSVVLDAAWG
ncbi:MAG: trypsin-like peptidase domain-containing protein [Lachnospiraceae bacterium]|nr:trypsin-like peptidase domain-containing protein [Lachnospiraceae bacterium]